MVDEFLSEEEGVVTKFKDFYLTEDRVIKLKKNRGSHDYQDIQLEKITSFDYNREFNWNVAVGGLIVSVIGISTMMHPGLQEQISLGLIGLGIAIMISAFLGIEKEYKIHSSNSDVKLTLPKSDKSTEFWKKINRQKNR